MPELHDTCPEFVGYVPRSSPTTTLWLRTLRGREAYQIDRAVADVSASAASTPSGIQDSRKSRMTLSNPGGHRHAHDLATLARERW